MAKHCPLYGIAIYMDCLECEEKRCKQNGRTTNIDSKNSGLSKGKENAEEEVLDDEEEDW